MPGAYTAHHVAYRGAGDVPLDFLGQARMLASLMRKVRFDRVYAHAENGLLMAPLCRRAAVPFHVVFHATWLPDTIWRRHVLREMDYHMLRSVVRSAARIAVFSEFSRSTVRASLGATCPPITVVPPGLADAWLTAPRPVRVARGPLRLLTWGRLASVKGVRHLLAALALPDVDRLGRVELDIVGDGPELPRLRRQARELPPDVGVRFHGTLATPAIVELCAAADVAVFPTLRESFGLVVAEALAAGVPVVASAVGSVPEVLGDGRWGRLVAPAQPAALLAEITVTAYKLSGLQARADEAREHALSRYRWDACAASLLGAGTG